MAPGIPHALFSKRAERYWQNSREMRSEIAEVCLMDTQARKALTRHHPRKRVIQYSRGECDKAEKPRRTGSPAFAEDDIER
jgi:hypothetical protein